MSCMTSTVYVIGVYFYTSSVQVGILTVIFRQYQCVYIVVPISTLTHSFHTYRNQRMCQLPMYERRNVSR